MTSHLRSAQRKLGLSSRSDLIRTFASIVHARRGRAAGVTAAELAVLALAAAGLSNAETAARRGVSPRTVANQMASIFRKLGVHSRLELQAWIAGVHE